MNAIIDFIRGILSVARMRRELDELDAKVDALDKGIDRRVDGNSKDVAELAGRLEGTLRAIHTLSVGSNASDAPKSQWEIREQKGRTTADV